MMRAWWSRMRAWLGGRRGLGDDLAEELQSHLDMETADAIERGLPREEARLTARRRVGNSTFIAGRARDAWGVPPLESFFQDVRQGLRVIRRGPGFSAVVILTFALGVGANTAVFGVVRAVLLKPLPYPDPQRLVWLGEAAARATGISVTWFNFEHWRAANRSFEGMAAFRFVGQTLSGRAEPVVTRGLAVTSPYFALLGMRPLRGRLFGAADDRPGAPPVLVLSHRFWSSRLGEDPGVVGATLTLNGTAYQVAGVAAPLWEPWRVDYYVPLGRMAGSPADQRRHGSMRVLARLRPGVTLAAASADLDAIMRGLAEAEPGPESGHRSFGRSFTDYSTGDARGTMLILMASALLILLIACANIASLLMARNTARMGELALRNAVGAGRLRLVRQLLTENIVIAVAGGLAGVGFARAALRALLALAPAGIPRLPETAIDPWVLVFACGMTLAAGLLAGAAPAAMAGGIDLTTALKESARTAGDGRRRQAIRNVLVVAEVALTFLLAFASGLLLRSLAAARAANPGFDTRGLLSFSLQLPASAYHSPGAVAAFYTRLVADLRALPGVAGAAAVHCPPGAGDCGDWFYSIPARPAPAREDVPIALFNSADAGYFRTMRIPVVQGREFGAADGAEGPQVAVVNETFASRWWARESAVGRQIKVGGPYQEGPLLQIVGVVGDVRQFGLDSRPMAEIFLPSARQRASGMSLMVRATGNPGPLMPAIRSRVRALDRDLPLQSFATLEESLGAGLAERRFSTLLLTVFAGLAMALAGVGIYGLLSYRVSSRESEIAVRLALGARPSAIMRWTALHALRLAGAGMIAGLLGARVAARALEGLVFGIPARHPATMAGAVAAVTGVALAAAVLPSWRASRVDPARRLHSA